MYYSVVTQTNSEKEIPSAPIRSRTLDLPITSSDALPLSYRRLVGEFIIHSTKLRSCNKFVCDESDFEISVNTGCFYCHEKNDRKKHEKRESKR